MKKNNFGSRNTVTTDPRRIGVIFDELLESEQLFKSIFPNTELGIDLKFLTSNPGRLDLGASLHGEILRDGEDHFTFLEQNLQSKVDFGDEEETSDAPDTTTLDASEKKGARVKRNPIVIPGNCVNLHRDDDGRLYPTFRQPVLSKNYTWKSFCIEAAKEILSLTGFVEKESVTE